MFVSTNFTSGYSTPYLTASEREVVDSISKDAFLQLSRKSFSDLRQVESEICGVRSDDFLSLLKYFALGYIPTEQDSFTGMEKIHKDRIYLELNPGSLTAIEELGRLSNSSKDSQDLNVLLDSNERRYSTMGIRIALARNLGGFIADNINGHFRDYHRDGVESVFDPMVAELSNRGEFQSRTIYRTFSTALNDEGCTPIVVRNFLDRIRERTFVQVAYGPKIFEYDTNDWQVDSSSFSSNEITVGSIDNRLGLDSIVGFTLMGDWEDGVLAYLQNKFA